MSNGMKGINEVRLSAPDSHAVVKAGLNAGVLKSGWSAWDDAVVTNLRMEQGHLVVTLAPPEKKK